LSASNRFDQTYGCRHSSFRNIAIALTTKREAAWGKGSGLQRPARNAVIQGHPFEQFHYDEVLTVLLADLVDRANVRVVKRPCLALEALQGCRIRAEFGREKLQRHVPAERFVLGLIDNAHATTTQLLDDAVVRNGFADHWTRIVRP
jgi:hypothetical protein